MTAPNGATAAKRYDACGLDLFGLVVTTATERIRRLHCLAEKTKVPLPRAMEFFRRLSSTPALGLAQRDIVDGLEQQAAHEARRSQQPELLTTS